MACRIVPSAVIQLLNALEERNKTKHVRSLLFSRNNTTSPLLSDVVTLTFLC